MRIVLAVSLSLFLWGGSARAQAEVAAPPPPAAAQPTEQPPPPPQQFQPAPQAPVPVQPQATGQWVYTAQYGWLWMPYGAQYTSEPVSDAAVPYAYVYYPRYGWSWLEAPWVWGWGASPYFGVYGPLRFHWYHRGWRYSGRGYRGYSHGYHFAYRHSYGYPPGYHGYRSGVRVGPPYRGGVGVAAPHRAGVYRPAYGGARPGGVYRGGGYRGGGHAGGHAGGRGRR